MNTINYRRYYSLFVITIIVVTVISQFIIRSHLESQSNDANKISLASYQSSVANEVAKHSLKLSIEREKSFSTKNSEHQLKKAIRKLNDRHKALVHGNVKYKLDGNNSEKVRSILVEASSNLIVIEESANGILMGEESTDTLINDLFVQSEEYNQALNEVVFLYEKENSEKISRLKNLELLLASIMIAVLLVEIFLVIKPALNKLKQNHIDLKEKNKELQRLNNIKSEFLANMSHEIRTPLNGVIGMARILNNGTLDNEQKDSVEAIKTSAQHLLDIINEILDFSKLESGKTKITEENFSLDGLVHEVFQVLTPTAKSKGLFMESYISENVPKEIFSDELKIRQILINLLGNAIKFTEKGSVSLEITISSDQSDFSELTFSVKDSGMGIPSEKLNNIFESFTQADNSKTKKFGGTGLGLSICKKLTKMLNGRIWVESQMDIGSNFFFTLLIKNSEAKSISAANPIEISQSKKRKTTPLNAKALTTDSKNSLNKPLSGSIKILIVEDNAINRAVALKSLEMLGLPASTAVDGLEAIKLIESEIFDLILMDIQMPNLDGYQCTEKIRRILSQNDQPIIIAMTATSVTNREEQFIKKGMDDYLPKPLVIEELSEKIHTWFE